MALSWLNVHNDFIELKHSFTPLSVVSIITMQKKRFKTIYKVMWKYKISQNTCVFGITVGPYHRSFGNS